MRLDGPMAKSGWHLCAFAVSLGIWGLSIVPKRRRALTSKLSGHFEARPQLYYCVPCWCSSADAAMRLIRQFRNLRLLALSTRNQLRHEKTQAGPAPLPDESLIRTARPVRGKIQRNSRQRRLPVKRNALRSRDAFLVFITEL